MLMDAILVIIILAGVAILDSIWLQEFVLKRKLVIKIGFIIGFYIFVVYI